MKYMSYCLKLFLQATSLLFSIQLIRVHGYQSLIAVKDDPYWLVQLIVTLLTLKNIHLMQLITIILDAIGPFGVMIVLLVLGLMIDTTLRRIWVYWIIYYIVGIGVVVCSLLLWYSNNYYDQRLFTAVRFAGWFLALYSVVGMIYWSFLYWKKVVKK